MNRHSLRWKAIASLLATAALLGGTIAWRGTAEHPSPAHFPPAPQTAGLPPLRLADPRVERNAIDGRIATVVLRAAPHLASGADHAPLACTGATRGARPAGGAARRHRRRTLPAQQHRAGRGGV